MFSLILTSLQIKTDLEQHTQGESLEGEILKHQDGMGNCGNYAHLNDWHRRDGQYQTGRAAELSQVDRGM